MAGLDLRPLSLGEILDRTFWLYRRYFLLFVGIFAIPQVIILALRLWQTQAAFGRVYALDLRAVWIALMVGVVSLVAYLFSQGGTVLAVSELYLGRSMTIGEALARVWEEFGSVFGVVFLNGIVVVVGFVLLVFPGVYLMCRLLVCIPVAMVEKRGALESLERSFELTRDDAMRAFLILVLSFVLQFAAGALFTFPVGVVIGISRGDLAMTRLWTALSQVGATVAGVLTGPILLIATAVYYYDLRVRKEAFDLQVMLNPDSQSTPSIGPPSILS